MRNARQLGKFFVVLILTANASTAPIVLGTIFIHVARLDLIKAQSFDNIPLILVSEAHLAIVAFVIVTAHMHAIFWWNIAIILPGVTQILKACVLVTLAHLHAV